MVITYNLKRNRSRERALQRLYSDDLDMANAHLLSLQIIPFCSVFSIHYEMMTGAWALTVLVFIKIRRAA